jgi:N-formylglutamate deformylase
MIETVRHLAGTCAVVLDSPHSGTVYPEDFGHACDRRSLRRAEDTHVEKLYDFRAQRWACIGSRPCFRAATSTPIASLAEIDESLIDGALARPRAAKALRAKRAKVRLGKGLIWRLTDEGLPLYDRSV